MKQELLDQLYNDYPGLFIKSDVDDQVHDYYTTVSVRDGWYHLIDDLCAVLSDHIHYNVPEELRPQIYAVQIKEKFGTLRFYLNHSNDYINGAVTMAEASSDHICETCGHPGVLRNNLGWLKTLCDKDLKKEIKDEAKRNKEYAKILKAKKK